jgi:PKD repeat protein
MTHAKAGRWGGRRTLAAMAVSALLLLNAGTSKVALADTAPAPGTLATVSADGLPTWQINGVVWSQTVVGNTVYATGSFTKARPAGVAAGGAGEIDALNVFAYDITTGNRVAFSHSLNAQGLAVAASPDGSRVYIGGDFTSVDGMPRGHVAAFDTATGAVVASFAPSVSNQVRALAATNSTVFIGGGYGSVNGATRNSLSAVAATGSLLPWAPSVAGGNVDVWSMVLTPDQSRVVVGGSFTTLNGAAASGMGSLDATTGASQAWAANTTIKNGGTGSAITSLRTDGQQIYGSGYAYGSGNFEGTFAANPTTGAITVVNDCHGDTYDVLPVGPVLYSVSHAHDCSWIGSFPDTSPRVRWEHALAQTIAPATTNKGPDNYGWSYNGLPASTVLHWFPQLATGSYTGQYQAAWSLAGSGDYVAMGGEFPRVNGVAQQGLVRMAVSSLAEVPNKQGPTYTTQPDRPIPATTATSPSPGTVSVSFGTAWDYDNQKLTYDLFRDGASTGVTTAINSNFWTLPTKTMTDTAVPAGTHTYQVRIADPFGNTLWSPNSNSVTVTTGTNAAPTASFTATPNGLSVSVNGSASTDPDGTIQTYAWNFGDSTTATGQSASHTYAVSGTYNITLTVTDNAGASNSATKAVTVAGNAAPTASFTTTVNGLSVAVNGSASSDRDGTIASYAWTFGDGGAATGATAAHTYAASGTYNVTLTVTDNAGATGRATQSVKVRSKGPH